MEVSTPELDDVVRLEDDFGREGTSAPVGSHGTISGVSPPSGGVYPSDDATAITGRGA